MIAIDCGARFAGSLIDRDRCDSCCFVGKCAAFRNSQLAVVRVAGTRTANDYGLETVDSLESVTVIGGPWTEIFQVSECVLGCFDLSLRFL